MTEPRTSDKMQPRASHRTLAVMLRMLLALSCALLLVFRSDRLVLRDPSSWAAAAALITLILWALWPQTAPSSSPGRLGRWGTLLLPAFRSSNGTAGVAALLLLGLLAPLLIPMDPNVQGNLLETRLLPPLSSGDMRSNVSPGSFLFLFGSDPIGRDVLSRLLIGTRTSLSIALAATVGSVLIGVIIGMLSAIGSRITNMLLTWVADVFLSIPSLFLVIALAFFFGHSVSGLLLVLIFSGWMRIARIIRGEVLHLREREFVQASVLLGQRRWQIIRKHILPNCLPVILTASLLQFSDMLLAEAALGFLGFGIQPPLPSWGNMLGDAVAHLDRAWWLAAAPGLALTILMLSLHQMTEALESALRT